MGQRVNIKFCFKLAKTASEMIKMVYGNESLDRFKFLDDMLDFVMAEKT